MTQPIRPRRLDADASTVSPSGSPALRVEPGGATLPVGEGDQQRLSRLATDLLRDLLDRGVPSVPVIARYLGVEEGDVLCIAEGVLPMTDATRRNLARVTLAFAPGAMRHTARRLLDGERLRRRG
ncbi:MAG TPA: hypothetical protein VEA99_13950 [Gemmatimonadaceae bacterium]|nr:hypothetical protein [Gemmatimonadaceae bacterium]